LTPDADPTSAPGLAGSLRVDRAVWALNEIRSRNRCRASTITQDTTNVATVTAKDPQGTPVAPKNDDAMVDVIHPALSITKDVNKPTVLANTVVTYTIRVTNTGDVPLNTAAVADVITLSCATSIGSLAVNGSHEYTCAATITQDTTNTAIATGEDPLGNPVAPKDDTATVDVIAPGISIEKSTSRWCFRAPRSPGP